YIVATRWGLVQQSIGMPDYLTGPVFVVTAGMLFVVGAVGTSPTLQQISLGAMTTGFGFLLLGRAAFRQVWFAAAYLLLMVPMWTDLIASLQVPSQMLSSRIAMAVLHAIGIPAVQEGTVIYLPLIALEVL